jgi:hypothetical protein
MRAKIVFSTVFLCASIASGDGFAQGTKDPSNPVPTMVFPIRPRDEPATSRPVAVPNHTTAPPIRLRRIYPVRVRIHPARVPR